METVPSDWLGAPIRGTSHRRLGGSHPGGQAHPEQGYRACLGIMRLAQHYERERMENAAQRALAWRALSYTRLKSILEKGLDRRPLEEVQETSLVATHENLRGPHYYGHREACSSC